MFFDLTQLNTEIRERLNIAKHERIITKIELIIQILNILFFVSIYYICKYNKCFENIA